MIGIRADGNKKIGIGHIMRCMTIADAIREQGEEVIFFLADNECVPLVENRGFQCCTLDSFYDDLDGEYDCLLTKLKKYGVELLLVDSYYVTPIYLTKLRNEVKIAYLDDMDFFAYPVDVLINYNVFAKVQDYPYLDKGITGLIGPHYAPVRREFGLVYREDDELGTEKEIKDILITLGGSDKYNLSEKIARVLAENTNCRLCVVCGPFNTNKAALLNLADVWPRVTVHENVQDMWNLMQKCDLAVSAAGSTMCELATAGVPSVTFSFVDNQQRIAEAFGQKEAALWVGHYESAEEELFFKRIKEAVDRLIADTQLARRIRLNAHELVDGRGAARIARELIMCKQK